MANELLKQEQKSGVTQRDEVFAIEQKRSAELASTAVSAAAKAEIEAGFIMAMHNRRNEDDARRLILDVCKKPSFAGLCLYQKPVAGTKIEGLSIRFAEEAMRLWKNVKAQTSLIYEDESRRIIKVIVYDLETNASWSTEISVEKIVERKVATGREVVSERLNTSGQRVFIVKATDDEIMNKTNSLISKAVRNSILRIIPEYILSEANAAIRETLKQKIKQDPDAEKNKILDAFGALGIMPSELEKYIGHPLKQVNENELIDLRGVYTSIKDGQSTWQDHIDSKAGAKKEPEKAQVNFKAGKEENHQSHEWKDKLREVDALRKKIGEAVYSGLIGNEGCEIAQEMTEEQLDKFIAKLKERCGA